MWLNFEIPLRDLMGDGSAFIPDKFLQEIYQDVDKEIQTELKSQIRDYFMMVFPHQPEFKKFLNEALEFGFISFGDREDFLKQADPDSILYCFEIGKTIIPIISIAYDFLEVQ